MDEFLRISFFNIVNYERNFELSVENSHGYSHGHWFSLTIVCYWFRKPMLPS